MDDFLPRATRLLQPLMSEERRGTWLALAFHGSNRAIHDAISQSGSTADFTVRCVRHLLDRGRVGSRHALSLLLETVRADAGDELQESFQKLIDELDARCSARRMARPADDAGAPAPPSPHAELAASATAGRTETRASAAPPLSASASPAAAGAAVAPRDFFISYNSHDKDWAVWIAWQLEAAGYTTLIQAWDFHAGNNFVVEMDRAARQS